MTIMRLCCVFKQVYVKFWNPLNNDSLKEDVAIILSLLGKEFSPTYFDIMKHLLMHVVEELDVCGIVHN
jgi:hypothetical protein